MTKGWLSILIFTFIVFLSWLAFDIYHARPSVPLTDKLQTALEPINSTFDPQIINQIQNIQTPTTTIPSTPPTTTQPTPTPSLRPISSPSPISTASAQPSI